MRVAEQLANDYDLAPRYSIWVKSSLARLWIAQGDLERASEFVRRSGILIDSNLMEGMWREVQIPYLREPETLVFLRLLLAQGDYDAALALSQRLLQIAETAKRTGRTIEVMALQALALQGKKDMASAMQILEGALLRAQPEGYARVFLDEGEPMMKLLYQAKSHRIGGGYPTELLSGLDGVSGTEKPPAQLLIEPLTGREIEVLKLIEAGCTNQEIAAKLVISVPTVKRHISNIYAKLGAKNRTQAVSLGKELRLFG
jgi:LuxR family maltose regulon positive regulatory protein